MAHMKEINKFLKQISHEKLKKNHRECIELYNIVGGLHSEIGSFDEACHYHEKALESCKVIGDTLKTAVAYRYIGEAKASLGNFYQAIDYIKKYLDLAQKVNNKVEIQRAYTTLGRVYLMQAQDLKDKSKVIDKQTREVAREAEKRFQTAYNLADSVRDQVDDKEYTQMISGLLTNLGLIWDICGDYKKAKENLNRAIDICRGAKLKEDIYRCQIILAGINRQDIARQPVERQREAIKLASDSSEEALATAKSLGKKILICEALIELGLVRIYQSNFKSAKRSFAKAYLESSPSEEDHAKAIRMTKLAHLIATTYEKFSKDKTSNEERLKLCDKLGDLFVAIGNYTQASKYYHQACLTAKLCSKPKSELARILYSLAETYADNGQFLNALRCYEKELAFRKGNNSEQCQSLIKISQMLEYLEREPEKVCETYDQALEKAGEDPKLMHSVLQYYVPYMKQKAYNPSRCRTLEETLLNLKSYPEIVDDIESDYEDGNELEDEIDNIDDIITDDEDNEEVLMIGRRRARGSNKFKPNELGETPLHKASIEGDLKRVKSLVGQGHDINPRDHAGWIPLHEACNRGFYHVAEFLIEHGADVNNRGLKGMSPLHDAATNGHFDTMRLLIKHGANVISLTDGGETVLSCLRDYKARNYSTMSNGNHSEYKQMEAELLNLMDKCGYNLMSENMKNLGNRAGSSRAQQPTVTVRGPSNRNPTASTTTLKVNSSADDLLLKRKREDTPPLITPTNYDDDDDDDDDDEIIMIGRKKAKSSVRHKPIEDEDSPIHCPEVIEDTAIRLESPIEQADPIDTFDPVDTKDSFNYETNRPISAERMSTVEDSRFMFDEPLSVTIEGRKLLVPVKDEYTSIAELKKSIIERYSILIKARPKISLAPISDPECILFDHDLCRDVIRESLVARVDSWELESIESTFLETCQKLELKASDFVKVKLRDFDQAGDKLNLSYTQLPQAQMKPFIEALARRDFISANFQGSTSWFKCPKHAQDLLESTLSTWSKLTRLNLKCCGLLKSHFELLCNLKTKLPELQYIDVSVNSIAYKSRSEFTSQVKKLRLVCGEKLRTLNVRKNHLLFVKTQPLELSDLKIDADDQYDYTVYLDAV